MPVLCIPYLIVTVFSTVTALTAGSLRQVRFPCVHLHVLVKWQAMADWYAGLRQLCFVFVVVCCCVHSVNSFYFYLPPPPPPPPCKRKCDVILNKTFLSVVDKWTGRCTALIDSTVWMIRSSSKSSMYAKCSQRVVTAFHCPAQQEWVTSCITLADSRSFSTVVVSRKSSSLTLSLLLQLPLGTKPFTNLRADR